MLYGDTLASSVSLVLPCGHTWKIGLVTEDNKIYLQKDWPKFIEHYQINGQLLIFNYRGSSNFDVSIIDNSSCELDYTLFPFNSNGKKNDTVSMVDLASSEESHSDNKGKFKINEETEDDTPTKMRRRKRRHEGPYNKGKSKINEEIEDDTPTKMRQRKKRHEGPYKTYKNTKAYKEASQLYSNNPLFRRIIRMKGRRRYNLRLPNSFVESHLGSKTQPISLKVGTKKWLVKLVNCNSGFFFSKGWSAFLAANSIHTGDACVFEFVSREPAVLKVSIFKK
ncbi:B3 domain-containing transcription factor VRN1-like isoform X2 [Humulus lupulus]|nr:B3 domain-containing transcription factor VRN1-like isoform X2 [Humulus lupulus]